MPAPLAVAADAPGDLPGRPVYCVGYPAYDGRRNEPESMRRIFMEIYNVKRLQPGTTTELVPEQNVMKHDWSTLGGNSGSPSSTSPTTASSACTSAAATASATMPCLCGSWWAIPCCAAPGQLRPTAVRDAEGA